ncbi:MAG: Uma2 family endonuclease [Longimicrobiales bacterium]
MEAQVPHRDGPFTVEEFARLPEEDAYRIELAHGWLVREPRPGARHGVLVGELYRAIDAHAREHGLGRALIETGFRFPGQTIVRGPDIAFISAARLPAEVPVGFWPLAPDLAVEVISPSDRWSAIEAKVREYLAAGTTAVWLVDPGTGTARVHRAGESRRDLSGDDALTEPDVLPGLTLPLPSLFSA